MTKKKAAAGVNDPYCIIMEYRDRVETSRVILDFDGCRFPMSIDDTNAVAKFAADVVMGGNDPRLNGVALEDGGRLDIICMKTGYRVDGYDPKTKKIVATMTFGHRGATLRFAIDIREAGDEMRDELERWREREQCL
ncbi:hypothetical protein [Nitrobacter sp.]|jgi:hypothetical protein|uniref:hypothetical protein n=1 Tax=Nitrobacter sp. TaxID=29420 RepID=UPI003F65080F